VIAFSFAAAPPAAPGNVDDYGTTLMKQQHIPGLALGVCSSPSN
jgi:hypothetical protein